MAGDCAYAVVKRDVVESGETERSAAAPTVTNTIITSDTITINHIITTNVTNTTFYTVM